MSHWNDPQEHLPPKGELVLAVFVSPPRTLYAVLKHDAGVGWLNQFDGLIDESCRVTHWRILDLFDPLPLKEKVSAKKKKSLVKSTK